MYAFRDPTHLRVTMPIKLLSLRYDHIEEGKLLLSFDGQGNNTMRLFDLTHDLVDLWYCQFIQFFYEETKMWRFDKGLGVEVIMFVCDVADQI